MKKINVPGIGLVNFPASMSDDEIVYAIENDILKTTQKANEPKKNTKAPERTFLGTVGDLGVSALKGAVAVPQAVVGLADIATGGKAGKLAEDAGIRFKDTQDILDSWKSDAGKAAQESFNNAEGFTDSAIAAVKNPSVIANALVESVPSIGVGGVIGKGLLSAAPRLGIAASAIGEGIVGAGSQAESIRQQTADGELTGKQSAIAAATGVGTSVFGALGGKIAQKLGIADVDSLATGLGVSPDEVIKKSFARKLIEGGLAEGVFEEMPQSAQEQMLSNYALDKPVFEGVDKAAAMGLVTGGVMGSGVQALNIATQKQVKIQESDAALDAISTATSVDDAIKFATEATKTPVTNDDVGLLNSINATLGNEAINASDVLGEETNVSDTNTIQTPEMATQAVGNAVDNVQGSAGSEAVGGTKSWVVVNKETGEPVMETFQKSVADKVNTEKYKAIPISEYLPALNNDVDSNGNRKPVESNEELLANIRKNLLNDNGTQLLGNTEQLPQLLSNPKQLPAEQPSNPRELIGNADNVNNTLNNVPNTLNDANSASTQTLSPTKSAKTSSTTAQKPQSDMTLPEFVEHKKAVNKQKFGNETPFDDNEISLQHLDYIESALKAGKEVTPAVLEGHRQDDIKQYKRISKLTINTPQVGNKLPTQAPKVSKSRKAAPKKQTLLTALRDLGGIKLSDKLDVTGEDKRFIGGGYNQVFKSSARSSLKGLIELGDLDVFLPYHMRLEANGMNDDAFDSTEAYDYLADKIRNGESVLPYDVEQEAKQNKAYDGEDLQADVDTMVEDDGFDLDMVNAMLREAGYDEVESLNESRDYETRNESSAGEIENTQPRSTASSVVSSERAQRAESTGSQSQAPNEVAGTPRSNGTEREGARPLVEAIVKRRAAANEINKGKQFDTYLQSAKDFLNGANIKPSKFQLASTMFARDPLLSQYFSDLADLARQPAKQARSEVTETLQGYRDLIEQTDSVNALRAIARDIQDETVLSDAQVQELDDLVMDKIDGLQVEDEVNAETATVSTTVQNDNAEYDKAETDFRLYPVKTMEAMIDRGDIKELYKQAGVKTADGFGDLPMDAQAKAYADYVVNGGNPVEIKESYNEMVMREERAIVKRRLESEREIKQANGKPFKTEASAKQFLKEYGLQETHDVAPIDGGYALKALSLSEANERKRKAAGKKSYIEIQDDVVKELGITSSEDGEIQATEEQWDEIDKIVEARLKAQDSADFTLQPETNEEILAREQAQKDADAEKARAEAKAKAEEDKRALEAQQRKNANERPFEFGEDTKKAEQAIKSGSEDLFAQAEENKSQIQNVSPNHLQVNKLDNKYEVTFSDEINEFDRADITAYLEDAYKYKIFDSVLGKNITVEEANKLLLNDALQNPDRYKGDLPKEIEIGAESKAGSKPATETKSVTPKTPLSAYDNAMEEFRKGIANVDDYKAAFDYVINNEQAITEYLEANFTKKQLFDRSPYLEQRYKSEKKDRVVRALYGDMVRDFLLPNENGMVSSQYGFGGDKYADIKRQVSEITQESLDAAMKRRQEKMKANEERMAERMQGMADPKTLEDYQALMSEKTSEGMTFQQARMSLTTAQRVQYDELVASFNREQRRNSKNAQKTQVQATVTTTSGDVIETKHTKTGEPLFVVKAADRVERETYNQWNTTAKRMGGYYSSFRGNGAVPGFQFKTRDNAEAFLKYLGGDVDSAKEAVQAKRNAYADDRSQTAVERLTEMADRLEQDADADLNRDRKVNTARRAGMAASAEAKANANKAMAITMRKIAQAIESGKAKFLDEVRQKTQVELLNTLASNARYKQLRDKYTSYADQEKHRYDPMDSETADFADFPTYTLYRSDWARLGRAMVAVDGFKAIGNNILSTADDVTDAYVKFAKENMDKVGTYVNQSGLPAKFTTKSTAEEAIAKGGFNGKAIAIQVKRGEYQIIESPQAAKEKGVWNGDDKLITLKASFMNEVVEKIGKANRRSNKLEMPWQLEATYDKLQKLARMGIETPAEMRSALREYIGLKENIEPPSKIKELERNMIGRTNDGLDFFPTPSSVADTMVEVADIKEGMTVLEPSAGMGHIAERVRDAGFEPDVIEFNGNRRELLELKGFNVVGNDFLDATEKYDRIIMNPPFSDRRDMAHVAHAYNLLKPNGRLVAIMGEGVFYGRDKKATEFRNWLDKVGGTSEQLEEGTFNDPSLPVNTSANARMVVIDKRNEENAPMFSRATPRTPFVAQEDEGYQSALNKVIALFKSGDRAKQQQAGKTPIPISRTPVVLRQVLEDDGSKPFKRAEYIVGQGSTLYLKADNIHSRSIHTGKISKDVLDKLPQLIADPIAVFKSSPASEDARSFKVLIDALDENGSPVIVGIKPNVKMQQLNGADVNFQATIFPTTWGKIREWNKNGLLRYYNEKSPRISVAASNPREAATKVDTQEGFDATIGVLASKVKVVSRGDIEVMPSEAFSRDTPNGYAIDPAEAKQIVDDLQAKHPNLPKIKLVYSRDEMPIPQGVLDEINAQIANKQQALDKAAKSGDMLDAIKALQLRVDDVEGMYRNGEVWINANAITTIDRLKEVFAHEAIGHYSVEQMLNEVDPKLFPKLIKQIQALNKMGNPYIKGVWADVKASQPTINDETIAKEVLAFIAERGDQNKEFTPMVRTLWQKIIDGIKAFAKLVFDVDMTDQDVRDIVAQAERYAKGEVSKQDLVSVYANGKVMFSIPESITLQSLFKELTNNDDMFKYGRSDAKDLQQVFDDVVPELVKVEKTNINDDEIGSFYHIYPIDNKGNVKRNQRGQVMVYKDGKVEINVAAWDEGFGGSRVYAAVGNWAYNNGYVFAGDRDGITSTGKLRRLENMISLALKFGTTDHIAPHPDQMRDLGFDWKQGDTDYNLGQMLEASYKAIRNGVYVNENRYGMEVSYKSPNALGVAKLDDLVYDFETRNFKELSSGKPYTDEEFGLLAQSREGRATNAGRTTLKRAVVAHTFIRAQSRAERQRLLELISKLKSQRLDGTQLDEIFYSRNQEELPDTITVDGIERPTLNSNGKPIHPTREGVENFWRWFSDSKVVDEQGRPLVSYRGRTTDREILNSGTVRKSTSSKNWLGDLGSWFAAKSLHDGNYDDGNDIYMAENFIAKDWLEDDYKEGANILPAYLAIKNPMEYVDDESNEGYFDLLNDVKKAGGASDFVNALKNKGFDGVVLRNSMTDGNVDRDDWIALAPNQIKSAIGNTGSFNPNNDSILFSRQSRLQSEWESLSDSTLLDDLVYKFQDKHKDLKDVTKAIKNTGAQIADRFNTYLQEELYHGRVAKRTQDFITTELEPLLKALGDSGIPMADFEHYLWARHAEERNAQIAKVNPDMPDGGSGLTNAEAKAYLSGIDAQTKAKMEKMAGMVDAINKRSRNLLVEYGIEDMDTAMKMESAYQHYVPLMRDEMEKGFGGGTGQGFSIKGNSTKRAMGSNKAVVDILANIAQQREKFIVRGEKNRVATALVGLAVTNPNDEFWKVDKPPVIRFINKTTGLVDEMTDPSYKSRDNVVVARILDKNGKVQERAVVFNEFDKRASRMAESLKNLDVDGMEEWVSRIGSITRYFASVNTQYNPLFGVVNITRDVQAALLNLSSTALANDKADVISNTPSALKGIYSVLRGKRKGKEVHNRWADLWDEFQREGGQTGYRELFRTAKDRTDELQKVVDPTWWRNTKWGKALSLNSESLANAEQFAASKVGKPLFQWLEDYNTTLENSVRLSAYKVALDKGMTKQQAASLAKNLTVNFNRKGASGARMGAFYAFFNASVQGTARIGETMFKDGKLSMIGKRIIAGGMMLGVIQALALAGFDDDDPPQFERDRNLIIPIGDKKYIKIPMPLGFHVIPSSARILAEYAMNGGKDAPELIAHLGSLFAESFNPVGGSGSIMQILSPTVTDPLVALSENQDFAGRPIYQKDFNSLDPTPGFKRAKDTATKVSTFLAEIINKATGGTDYQPGIVSPTPDQIDYLVGQAFGGVGRESMKIENLATSMVDGTDLPTYKIPLLGKFYGNSKQQASEGAAFYRNIEAMNRHENEIKGRMEDGLEVKDYLVENPEAMLWRQANFSYRVVSKLRDRRQRLLDGGAHADDIKKVDEQITAQMRRFNEMVSAKENPPS